jgi:hypothetical protein
MPCGRLGDGAPEIGCAIGIVGRGDRWEALKEWPAMIIQLSVFIPAVIAIYTATGAWVFSCDPVSKTVDLVRGGLLYAWIGVLFTCTQVLVFQRYGRPSFEAARSMSIEHNYYCWQHPGR